jgi:ribosomal protein S18 acetylase RimI-like enzyme
MYRFRPLRNSDPPYLAEIWSSQKSQRGLAQPISVTQLEQSVLGKLIFDPQGMIVATHDDEPVGFVHAAFGPSDDGARLSTDLGVICRVMVHAHALRADGGSSLADELICHGEDFLRRHGARLFYAGGVRPLNPFYLGLYGGSELPGILDSDSENRTFFRNHGYAEIDRVIVLQSRVAQFRPVIDRRQLSVRRRTEIAVHYDPHPQNWWEATTEGRLDRTRLELVACGSREVLGSVTYWNLEPLASSWGLSAAGLLNLNVASTHRRQGIATYLLGEVFRRLKESRVTLLEAQTMQHNAPALGLYSRLGFVQVDQGAVLRKSAGNG